MRTENDRPSDDANDYRQARAGIVNGLPHKIQEASSDPEKRSGRIKNQGPRSSAEQGKRNQRENCTQLQRSPALAPLAHPTQVIFGMGRDHSRKVTRQLEGTRLVESKVERAKQLSLGPEFRGAIRARLQVFLKSLQVSAAQFAVKIRGNIFELTSFLVAARNLHRTFIEVVFALCPTKLQFVVSARQTHFGISDKLQSLSNTLRTGDAPLEQMIAHRFARAKQPVLDSAERETGDFGNFVVA